ncbi:MAG: 6-bladed beta-propeller [Gemmatimonas sp.]
MTPSRNRRSLGRSVVRLTWQLTLGTAVAINLAHAQLATPLITTLPSGRVQVKNTGPSKWLGTSGWKLVLERTIMPPEGSPGMLERPTRLTVTTDGQLIVYDAGSVTLRQYSAEGQFIRKIGNKGQGPGEYEFLLGFDARDGVVAAYAPGLRRLIMWKSDGTFIRQWATPSSDCGDGPTMLGANATVVIPACVNNGNAERAALMRFSATGMIQDTILTPLLQNDPPAPAWQTGAVRNKIPFSPIREFTLDSRLRYVYGWSGTYSLIVANRGTDTARIIQLPGKAQTIAPKFTDSVYERTQRGALKGIAKRTDFPTEFPMFTALHSDELDNIWIDRPGPDYQTANYDVIDRDGRLLGTVAAPPGLSRGTVWRNSRMYRISENADGLPTIQVFKVERGKY